MEDNDLERLLVEHFERTEKLLAAKPQRNFQIGDLTAIVAVIGMVVSISQSWAVTGRRIELLETTQKEHVVKLDKVPQLEWNLSQMQTTMGELKNQSASTATQVAEMHDTLIRMGLNLNKSKP